MSYRNQMVSGYANARGQEVSHAQFGEGEPKSGKEDWIGGCPECGSDDVHLENRPGPRRSYCGECGAVWKD